MGFKKTSQLTLWWLSGKESPCQFRRHGFDPWVRRGNPPWYYVPTDTMHWEKDSFSSVRFLSQMNNLNPLWRNTSQTLTEGHCTKEMAFPLYSSNVKVMKDKERLENSSRVKATKENMAIKWNTCSWMKFEWSMG